LFLEYVRFENQFQMFQIFWEDHVFPIQYICVSLLVLTRVCLGIGSLPNSNGFLNFLFPFKLPFWSILG
jgi:hypothetical protein